MPRLKIGVYGPAARKGLEGVLRNGTQAGADFRSVGFGGSSRNGPDGVPKWLQVLVQGDVDLALCPLEAVRETLDDRIEIVGVPERGDPRDVLLGRAGAPTTSLAALPSGGAVAVADIRAAGLLTARRPDLRPVPAAELADDLARLDDSRLAAVVVSRNRIVGTSDERRVGEVLPPEEWVPAPGQAALAILARRGEAGTIEAGGRLVNREITGAVRAEVAAARALRLPRECGLGVAGIPFPGGLRLRGIVVSADGRRFVRAAVTAAGNSTQYAAVRLAAALRRRGAELDLGPVADTTSS